MSEARLIRTKAWFALAGASLALASVPAAAEWNADAVKTFGGSYAADCADAASLHLKVDAGGLTVEKKGRTISAPAPDPAFSYLGPSPPPTFQAALLAQARGGGEVVALVHRDAQGRFVELGLEPRTAASFGLRANESPRLRDCDTGRRGRDGAAAVAASQEAARDRVAAAAASPLAEPEFKRLYRQALGSRVNVAWLAGMAGPGTPQKSLRIGDTEYVQMAFCKAHDCGDNNAVLLYARSAGKLYGLVFEGGRNRTLIGQPPPPVASQLDRLWRAEWRGGR